MDSVQVNGSTTSTRRIRGLGGTNKKASHPLQYRQLFESKVKPKTIGQPNNIELSDRTRGQDLKELNLRRLSD